MDSESTTNTTDNNMSQPSDKVTEKLSLKKRVELIASKLGNVAINSTIRSPVVPIEGKHPPWPGYTGIGTTLDFKLKLRQYKHQTLVENTIFSYYPTEGDLNLTPKQISARQNIISLYEKVKNMNQPIRSCDMRRFMRLFDQFFFFGAMTKKPAPLIFFKLWDKESPLLPIFANSLLDVNAGFNMDHYIRGYGLISAIHVAGPSFYSEGWPPCYYIRVLLHEMVHAYLSLYMCHCLQCHCDMVNTSGVTGHGPSFLMMMDSIDDTLKTWDIGLEGVLRSSADGRGHGSFDEVRFHRNQELRKFRQLIGRTNNSGAYNAATMAGDSSGGVSMDANGKVKVTMKDMKPLGREPGMHIYMSAARIGTTKVSKSKLIDTGNTVQALLKARTERRSFWPITYKKAKQSTDKIEVADEIEMIRERDFDEVEDLAAYKHDSDSDESEESEETPLFLIVLGLINRLTRRAWQRMRV